MCAHQNCHGGGYFGGAEICGSRFPEAVAGQGKATVVVPTQQWCGCR
jgi:hypothetical protein